MLATHIYWNLLNEHYSLIYIYIIYLLTNFNIRFSQHGLKT